MELSTSQLTRTPAQILSPRCDRYGPDNLARHWRLHCPAAGRCGAVEVDPFDPGARRAAHIAIWTLVAMIAPISSSPWTVTLSPVFRAESLLFIEFSVMWVIEFVLTT